MYKLLLLIFKKNLRIISARSFSCNYVNQFFTHVLLPTLSVFKVRRTSCLNGGHSTALDISDRPVSVFKYLKHFSRIMSVSFDFIPSASLYK